jgi:hypothetical protein
MPRTVAVHEHVIEQGFIDHVKSKGRQPLFYDPSTGEATNTDISNPRRPRYAKVRERPAEWARSLGITDRRYSYLEARAVDAAIPPARRVPTRRERAIDILAPRDCGVMPGCSRVRGAEQVGDCRPDGRGQENA